jgi:hypothetical protein
MKIVRIIGGLGNQLFQYSLYLALKQKYPSEVVKIDISLFNDYKLHSGFDLTNIFNIYAEIATKKEIRKYSRTIDNYKLSRIIRHLLPPKRTEFIEKLEYVVNDEVFITNKVYFEGYWQNENYFKKIESIVKSQFSVVFDINDKVNISVIDDIINSQSVSVHIRRGDYLNHHFYKGICELDYYERAIKLVNEKISNPVFFIFSNDFEWVKSKLPAILDGNKYVLIDWNYGENSYKDMILMSLCKYNVIANSTFSWWAAWLNSNLNKMVICPDRWTNIPNSEEIIPKEWIKL